MQKENFIAIEVFCANHNVEISFIVSLQQNGLIEIFKIQEKSYIASDQLEQLEKIVRLYNELDINIEGIESITHLLERLKDMQLEIITLKNRLRLYE